MENKVAYYDLDSRHTLFLVQVQSSVALTGKVAIFVLKGNAEVLGYKIPRKKKVRCYSSKGLPLLVINPLHTAEQKIINAKYIAKLFSKLKIEAEVSFPTALIFLVKHSSPITKEIGPTLSYFKIWQTRIDEIMATVGNGKQTVMVTGAKNTGKSSFLIHLINTALNNSKEIYCIDTDLGKPLFTLEGAASLSRIKAPILSNRPKSQKTLKSFLINDTSPKDKPLLYMKAIAALYSHYTKLSNDEELLVVNTHGWTDGLGFTLLEQITKTIKPSIIVSLEPGTIADKHEYESTLRSEVFQRANPDMKVVHVDQKDIRLQSQTTEKYKIRNIDELFPLSSCSGEFVPFEDVEFMVPSKDLIVLEQLSKYEVLSIFNAQYVALVALKDPIKETKIEDIIVKVWNEEVLLSVEGVGFISNINYNEGLHISKQRFAGDTEAMKYTVIPLKENIHPRWLPEDPVTYIGMPYYYGSYSDMNFTTNKRLLNTK